MIDDYYFLYATLASGMQALFVSNDTLGDHIAEFPPKLLECFKRWQQSRQVNVEMVSEGRRTVKLLQVHTHHAHRIVRDMIAAITVYSQTNHAGCHCSESSLRVFNPMDVLTYQTESDGFVWS